MAGINTHRLASNPMEQRFADQWAETNKNNEILKYMLDRTHGNRGDYVPTPIEEETAATVIQWLGSPVGQWFLRDALGPDWDITKRELLRS